jgi:hypothetical protein
LDLSILRNVYEHDGPFATVYLEGRGPGADAGEQIRLRWRDLHTRLASAGATVPALEALERELGSDTSGEEYANGRVLVASEAGVLLDKPWDAALGAGDAAHWTTVPELGRYVREAAQSVRLLVIVCSSHGADFHREVVAQHHDPREISAVHVAGSRSGKTHKPRGGGPSHKQIQRHVEETVAKNAKDIVEHARKAAARFRPRVIVLAGEVQARTAVRQQLTDDIDDLVVETGRGPDEHASDEGLDEELLAIADDQATNSNKHHAGQLHAGLAHDYAVQGHEHVAKAAEVGAVETLLFEPGTTASGEASLLKTCAQTSSGFGLVAEGTALHDGVGALLRFPLPE